MPVETLYSDGEPVRVIDLSHTIKLTPRWMLGVPPPGHGDISDVERQVAAEIGVAGVDDELGFRSLFYATKEDADKVARGMMDKHPEWTVFVIDGDGGIELTDALRKPGFWKDAPAAPHAYSPDYMAQGDCRVCGRVEADPVHGKATEQQPSVPLFYETTPTRGDDWVKEAFLGKPKHSFEPVFQLPDLSGYPPEVRAAVEGVQAHSKALMDRLLDVWGKAVIAAAGPVDPVVERDPDDPNKLTVSFRRATETDHHGGGT